MNTNLKILLLLHFAVKEKDGTHSSDENYKIMGITQNQISQYFSDKCSMPRSVQIAMAQHIMHSLKIHKKTHIWLDGINKSYLDCEAVENLISYIEVNKKLSPPRGRTKDIAMYILKTYKAIMKD